MKFDCIIMNPPYDGNTHLKILTEALKPLKDNSSKCVNLSPIRWLQDKTAKYKTGSDLLRFEYDICVFIENLEIITARDFFKLFKVFSEFDLGITTLSNKGGYDYKSLSYDPIIEKVMDKNTDVLVKHIEHDKINGYRVRIQFLRPQITDRDKIDVSTKNRLYETCHNTKSWVYLNGINKDGIHWTQDNPKGFLAGYTLESPLPDSVPFKDKTTATNFEQSTKTIFYRYLVYSMKTGSPLPVSYLPFMEKVTNERTGLVGYESDWTDEDFYSYYGITEAERKRMEETLKPYL